MKQKQHYIWMPLIGFDKEYEDRGASEFLSKTDFQPKGVSVFLFHSDIVNEHENMDKEFVLHPDNCSYYAAPRNELHERQDWTNYDLRILAHNLTGAGVEAYLGIMGVYLENVNHPEWESNHRELMSIGRNGRMNLNVLKRFKDGTYYEDFFAEKIVKATTDYGFSGLHVADFFCPPEHSIINGDYSADMMDQFLSHTGICLPERLTDRLAYDEPSDIEARYEYLWYHLRSEWIEFYAWRWESFWKKICDRLHAIGKKVMINNAWCSDPFEAYYRYGIDYRRLYRAGVDILVAETVANGMELISGLGDKYYDYMCAAQLMNAFSPDNTLLTLLGVKDSTEEWDMLHHQPCRLEKDIYHLGAMLQYRNGKYHHSTSGLMLTLGDGITQEEYSWISDRESIGFSFEPQELLEPTLLWSDHGHYALLQDYIRTRRPSTHRLMYTLKNAGAPIGSVARTEEINHLKGTLIAPNFDLFSAEEQQALLSYRNGAVICIAGENFDPASLGVCCPALRDTLANYRLCAFVLHAEEQNSLTAVIDGQPVSEEYSPATYEDAAFFTTPMYFAAVSSAFVAGCVQMICDTADGLFHCDASILTARMSDGRYRLYLYNSINRYLRKEITCIRTIDHVEAVSKYPVMPARYRRKENDNLAQFDGAKNDAIRINIKSDAPIYGFIGKVPPFGLSIYDIWLKE